MKNFRLIFRWQNPVIKVEKLSSFICIFLIFLMFISKISLKWTGVVPRNFSFLIYQNGMHPYINFALNFFAGIILFYIWFKNANRPRLNVYYSSFLYLFIVVLAIQTLLQITFVNVSFSPLMQLAGLGMTVGLVFIYGIIIPTLLPLEIFANVVKKISVTLIIISLCLLPLLFPLLFRGGRFIGVFKHIPHMVSASTFAFIFFIPTIFSHEKFTLKKNTLISIFILILLAFAVFLTATKAAMVTVIIVLFTSIMIYGSKKASIRSFKFVVITTLALAILMFGIPATDFLHDVATGKQAFLMRPAQDGVDSRMEEIFRGLEMFHQNPWFGKGILYKFMGGDGVDVNGYNSFKDPHNIFVSAGVVGGWPLMILTIIGYILMILASVASLSKKDIHQKMLGLFMISHLPVFVIYHLHLSLGGLGDRMYWLIFGYVAVKSTKKFVAPLLQLK